MKTSLWRAASSIVDYDVSIVSTLALEKGGDASVVVSTLGTVAKGAGSKDLLLVIEGFVTSLLSLRKAIVGN